MCQCGRREEGRIVSGAEGSEGRRGGMLLGSLFGAVLFLCSGKQWGTQERRTLPPCIPRSSVPHKTKTRFSDAVVQPVGYEPLSLGL